MGGVGGLGTIRTERRYSFVNSGSDELLMMCVRDGEVEKLGILYERHRGPLFNYFVRMVGSRSAGEDLVHDVFLRLLKYRHTFETGKVFRTWMYQIAKNAQIDAWHKRSKEIPWEDPGAERNEAWSIHEASPAVELRQQQERALLQKALAELPLESREVLVLARFQGLKYEEIARVLDCSVGAVKMRVHRALKDLEERFKQLSKEPS